MLSLPPVETFTPDERAALAPFFTNADRPVFALRNLPEVVKGALFARYSRSAKSLRRLFLDEFLDEVGGGRGADEVGVRRAEKLYAKVLGEYGDDSVAQLGVAHVACEGVSNVLTKVLEWGRLMSYLEQSTRYVPYTDRPGDRWKYHVPVEIETERPLRERFVTLLDDAFETYARWLEPMQEHFAAQLPPGEGVSDVAYRATIRAKALDALRGLLPAATRSNVGICGSGQGYEAMLLRMRGHASAEVRTFGEMLLAELREVIPAFLTRVDRPDRGGVWTEYLATNVRETDAIARRLFADVHEVEPPPRPEVTLADFDPIGELKVIAAALYPSCDLPDDRIQARVHAMTRAERAEILQAYVGDRKNRRHKPGRAFERTSYRFDVLSDYGSFRDLQRHRMLTIEWQPLTTDHGYDVSPAVKAVGARDDWDRVMEQGRALHDALRASPAPHVAGYAVPMAYRIRYVMEMNAREAMHLIELRSAPQGHPTYRRVAQAMHRLIAQKAGHRAIAAAMTFADHSDAGEGRLRSEQASEAKRRGPDGA